MKMQTTPAEVLVNRTTPEFQAWPKIARWSRQIIVTEKIDGTNAQVYVADDGQVFAGSRSRFLTPEDDNFGFAAWVKAHEEELKQLGPGRHYGEWWGAGIQRRYGLTEKRFSLFNASRWLQPVTNIAIKGAVPPPACCGVVPILRVAPEPSWDVIQGSLAQLIDNGSFAAPGFMKPEGIVIYHTHSGQMFKKTIEKDEVGKDQRA